jgi:hypothetical protein
VSTGKRTRWILFVLAGAVALNPGVWMAVRAEVGGGGGGTCNQLYPTVSSSTPCTMTACCKPINQTGGTPICQCAVAGSTPVSGPFGCAGPGRSTDNCTLILGTTPNQCGYTGTCIYSLQLGVCYVPAAGSQAMTTNWYSGNTPCAPPGT